MAEQDYIIQNYLAAAALRVAVSFSENTQGGNRRRKYEFQFFEF